MQETAWAMQQLQCWCCHTLYTISIHAPLAWCDATIKFAKTAITYFNPRTAWAMRRTCIFCGAPGLPISIHAPRERCDILSAFLVKWKCNFNPRTAWAMRLLIRQSPTRYVYFNPRTAWAMRHSLIIQIPRRLNFNPRTAWAMRRHCHNRWYWRCKISIHAPRERCDGEIGAQLIQPTNFNPRTAWAMRRRADAPTFQPLVFQSTHRVSDATSSAPMSTRIASNFNPRTAWAMRQLIRN